MHLVTQLIFDRKQDKRSIKDTLQLIHIPSKGSSSLNASASQLHMDQSCLLMCDRLRKGRVKADSSGRICVTKAGDDTTEDSKP